MTTGKNWYVAESIIIFKLPVLVELILAESFGPRSDEGGGARLYGEMPSFTFFTFEYVFMLPYLNILYTKCHPLLINHRIPG